jgi:hypothetical protein
MYNRHITHLVNHYINGQLSLSLRARVVNHVRECDTCRAALARQERIVSELGRDLPAMGYTQSGQLASVFAGVMSGIQSERWQDRLPLHTWLPGVTVALVMLLVVAVMLPLLGDPTGRSGPGADLAESPGQHVVAHARTHRNRRGAFTCWRKN